MHTHFSGPDEILDQLIERYPVLSGEKETVRQAFSLMETSFEEGGKLLLCGNGGSAADAMHISGELMKAFVLPRRPDSIFASELREKFPADADFMLGKLERGLPAIALAENAAVSTAILNDTASELVFAQQVYALGRQEDVLFGISTSGHSRNVMYAIKAAKAMGMTVVTLTGKGPNPMTELSDCQIAVPETETFRVQELHLPVYHALCLMLEHAFFMEESDGKI